MARIAKNCGVNRVEEQRPGAGPALRPRQRPPVVGVQQRHVTAREGDRRLTMLWGSDLVGGHDPYFTDCGVVGGG